MSAYAEKNNAAKPAGPAERYDRIVVAVHWSSLLLVIAAYVAVWGSHYAVTREQETVLVQLHRSFGVTVFALTLFRLGWRWHARIPPLPSDLPDIQKLAARATEYLLYLLLLLQPVL